MKKKSKLFFLLKNYSRFRLPLTPSLNRRHKSANELHYIDIDSDSDSDYDDEKLRNKTKPNIVTNLPQNNTNSLIAINFIGFFFFIRLLLFFIN